MRPDWRDPKYWNGPPPAHLVELADRNARGRKAAPLPEDPEEIDAIERERLALGYELAKLRLEWELLKIQLKGQKAGFNPEQPRVPAGNSDGGKWTNRESFDFWSRVRLAGPPLIPRQRPPNSKDRTAVAKAVASWAMEKGLAVADIVANSSWLYSALPYVSSYLDAPKSLGELQEDASTRKLGYDRHHIVEQSSAEEDGYPRSRIDAPDNLVRVPRLKHWEINAWYQIRNEDYGGVSPREYLRGKDWDERRRVGLDALIKHGVLGQ